MPDRQFVFAPFRLDVVNEQLWQGDELVPLRPKLFAALCHLVEHAGRLVTQGELRQAVWPTTVVSESVLRGVIRELRDTLGDDATAARFVETVPYRGYRFVAKVVSGQYSVASSPSPPPQNPGLKPKDFSTPTPNPQPLAPTLVGRDRELQQLDTWLNKARNGERQVVFVTGEPGIGKTTLVDAFLSEARGWRLETSSSSPASSLKPQASSPLIARGQCIEHYGAGEAYLPVLEVLGQLSRQPNGGQIVTLLSRYAPTWLVQMPALVSENELEILQRKVQGATRERMLREMAEAVEALTAEQPLVLVLEDLHWSDHSTLDLLGLLAQRRGPARLLLLTTYRPADVIVSDHPLRALKQELQVHRQCEELALGFLTVGEVSQYLSARFPEQQFPTELASLLHQSTEGNPLFTVNVVDEWVRQEVFVETDGQWQLAIRVEELAARVPESLRQMIEKQLERLTREEQRLVEAASVVGGEFTTAVVATGMEENEERVEKWCEALSKRAQFLRARGAETLADGVVTGRYGFLHALYPQVLYELLTPLRRVSLHRRIRDWGERAYGERVGEHAAELARHCEQGQDDEPAVRYLHQAAENALRRSAPQEAIAHATKALALLNTLPPNPSRVQQELGLLLTLGTPLLMTKGYSAPEVENVYARARVLCQQVGETSLLFPALHGLFLFHLTRAQLKIAHALAEQLLRLAQSVHDPLLLLGAHGALEVSLLYRGEISAAEAQTQEGLALYDPTTHRTSFRLYGQDVGVAIGAQGSWSLWLLGYPDQALQRARDALTLARDFAHPFSLAFALYYVAVMHQFRRESHAALRHAEEEIAFAHAQNTPFWLAIATIIRRAELVEQGADQEGLEVMRQGLATYRGLGADIGSTYWVGLIAEKYGRRGQPAEGLAILAEAFMLVGKNEEHWWEAELYRLKGELTLAQSSGQSLESRVQANQKSKACPEPSRRGKNQKFKIPSPQPPTPSAQEVVREVEACFLNAIAIARRQQARSLELRAIMSLVRLRQQQAREHRASGVGRRARKALTDGHSMLSEAYNWFTEGFDTPDLQEAKALLESLVRPATKSRGGSVEAEARSRRETPGR